MLCPEIRKMTRIPDKKNKNSMKNFQKSKKRNKLRHSLKVSNLR